MDSIQRVVDRSNRVAEHEQRGRMAGPGTATWYAEELATVPEFNMKAQEVLLAELIRALQPADPNFLEVFVATDGTLHSCIAHNIIIIYVRLYLRMHKSAIIGLAGWLAGCSSSSVCVEGGF